LKELLPDERQPRQDFDETALSRLKMSIEDKGIITPITVEPKVNDKHLIIDGERRYRIAQILKMKTVPVNVLSSTMDEFQRNIVRFQLQETHQSWTPFEKAEAMSSLKNYLQLNNRELAKALAIATVTADRYLSLLTFPVGYRPKFIAARLPFSYLETLSTVYNVMPEKISKKIPDFIDRLIAKYKAGYVRSGRDFRMISQLIRAGALKHVEKFIMVKDYTAENAAMDSGFIQDRFSSSIHGRAKKLLHDLQVALKNNIELTDENMLILNKIKELV
jgi:ParB/RepB/Spo0J family partition protein